MYTGVSRFACKGKQKNYTRKFNFVSGFRFQVLTLTVVTAED